MARASASLVILSVFLSAVSGCVSTKPTYLADGRRGYLISCNRIGLSWESCLAQAGKICSTRGYSVGYENRVDGEFLVSCR
jgi:hypothetical protein